jgi:hypothetical protein
MGQLRRFIKLNSGDGFNSWTIIEQAPRNKHNQVMWLCRCDCGNVSPVQSSRLRNGLSKSCGKNKCRPNAKRIVLEPGDVFNSWTVLELDTTPRKNTDTYYMCKCVCGTIRSVKGSRLKTGRARACGLGKCSFSYLNKSESLIGKVFGKLTVLDLDETYRKRTARRHKCICECGNIVLVRTSHLNNSYGKAGCGCGLVKKDVEPVLYNRIYKNYISHAKRRNINFDLDYNFFINLIRQPCYYCGTVDSNRAVLDRKTNPGYLDYNGVDRKDSKGSYSLNNVVTCCIDCNLIKNTMHHDDFIEMANKIAQKHPLKLCE